MPSSMSDIMKNTPQFKKPTFSIEEGIACQTYDLRLWKSVLTEDSYNRLEVIAKENNHTATSGYDICRGQSLYEIICNKIMNKNQH